MKTFPFVRFFLFLAMLLFTYCEKNGPETVHIPDQAFLDALIVQGVDKDGDGQICSCEAERVINLDVSELYNISSLEGIEAFINLEDLDCSDNQLSTLDIRQNTSLVSLSCRNMPTLEKVCVWTLPFPPANVLVDSTNSPNAYFSTDCSN